MEDFKVVDVTPHGHVNEHVKHHPEISEHAEMNGTAIQNEL